MNFEHTEGEEFIIDELLDTLNQERHFVVLGSFINGEQRIVVIKSIPSEDVMLAMEGIWSTDLMN